MMLPRGGAVARGEGVVGCGVSGLLSRLHVVIWETSGFVYASVQKKLRTVRHTNMVENFQFPYGVLSLEIIRKSAFKKNR